VLPDSFNVAREFIRSGSHMSRAYLFSDQAFKADYGLAVRKSLLTKCLSLQAGIAVR